MFNATLEIASDMDVGAAVRAIREERGMLMKDLAKQMGFVPVQMSKRERGDTRITGPERRKIASILGVTDEFLLATARNDGILPHSLSDDQQATHEEAPIGLTSGGPRAFSPAVSLPPNPHPKVAVKVMGNSMSPVVEDGEIIQMRRVPHPAYLVHGALVSVNFGGNDDNAMFWWCPRPDGSIRLMKANGRYVKEEREVRIEDLAAVYEFVGRVTERK